MSMSAFKMQEQLRRLRARPRDSEGSENSIFPRPYEEDSPAPVVGFRDPALRHVRNRAIFRWVITTVILMTFVFAVLSLYWGALYHVSDTVSSLAVWVIDFDGVPPFDMAPTIVGPAMRELTASQASHETSRLGWSYLPPSEFDNDPTKVFQAVYHHEVWAAIIVNPNATSMLRSAIATGNSTYEPMGACQLVYIAARDKTNWYDFILPEINMFMQNAQKTVGQKWIDHILPNASDPTILANMQNASQALNPAIGFSQYNLRPFWPYTTLPAVGIGLIYLIIIAFFSITFYLPIHMSLMVPNGHPPLKFWQSIVWRWGSAVLAYLFLSLSYSLVSVAFQIKFIRTHLNEPNPTHGTAIERGNPVAYGHGTFPVYWMLNFWGMVALGLACENVAMVVGPPWMGLWLVFWLITNVCTSFYDIEILPRFYRWGYAWPLHQVVEGSRHILFDLHSHIGLNFGILVAWGAVNTALFPFCCWFLRWKTRKGVTEYWSN